MPSPGKHPIDEPDFGNEVPFEAIAPTTKFPTESDEVRLVCDVLGDTSGANWNSVSSLPTEAFALPQVRAIWTALKAGVAVDDVVELIKAARITTDEYIALSAGYVSSAMTAVYADKVRREYRERRIREIAAEMVRSPDADLKRWQEAIHDLEAPDKIRLVGRSPSSFKPVARDHASVLLGNRFLNRGDGLILSSTSGMGKSSIALQAASTWALGQPFFGISCNGPLRSLVMQSEDGDGDVAEVFASIADSMGLTAAELAKLDKNIRVVTDRVHRGESFIAELKRQVALFKPDIVWINPLMGFMDGDLNDARDAGKFLRDGLNGLNEPAQFGYIIIHHTTKPPKEKNARQWNEVMYDMAGSADLTNWARAIVSLRASDKEGDFSLVLAKRGRRAGVTREVPQGTGFRIEYVTKIPLRHSDQRVTLSNGENIPAIYWVEREPDAKSESEKNPLNAGRKKKYFLKDFIDAVPTGVAKAEQLAQIHRTIKTGFKEIDKSTLSDLLNEGAEIGIVIRAMRGTLPVYYRP